MTTAPQAAKTDPFYRSSYAIKRELEPGLKQVTRRLHISLAGLLEMLAEDPALAEKLLSERAAAWRASNAVKPRPDASTREQRKALAEKIRNADPETLAKMMEAAGAAQG